jgi:hypothetical protein
LNQWVAADMRDNRFYRTGFGVALLFGVMALAMGALVPASAADDATQIASPATDLSGLHDFDFLAGEWRTHHRRLKDRLASSHEWVEFDGTLSTRLLMGGWANSGDNWFNIPGGAYRGVSLRSYDSKTGQWAIWWLDSRDPFGALDPPMKGRFTKGVGTFLSDDTFEGRPIKVRGIFSSQSPTLTQWEQAFSVDGGKTWETNWVMRHVRI